MLDRDDIKKVLEGTIDEELRRLLGESGATEIIDGDPQDNGSYWDVQKAGGEGDRVVSESYVARPKPYRIPTESLSEKTKEAHQDLYKGYVESLNRASAELDTVDRKGLTKNGSDFRSLKYDEIHSLNSVYLHELYFANIGDPHSEVSMDELAFLRLERDFGTFDRWQYDFLACCESAGEAGWALTVYNMFLRRYMNVFVTSHVTNVPVGCYPVIVVDMHAHSYHHDYLNNKMAYARAMMKELNWRIIDERFKRADLIQKALEA